MQQYSVSSLAIFEIRSDHTSSVCLLSPSFGHQDGFFTVTSTLPKVMVGLSNPSFNLTTPRPRFPSTAINFPTDLPAPFFRPCSTSSAGFTNKISNLFRCGLQGVVLIHVKKIYLQKQPDSTSEAEFSS